MPDNASSRASQIGAELREIGELVAYPPETWRESWADMFNGLRRVRLRLSALADRLDREALPPARKPRWAQMPKRERLELAERKKRARRILSLPPGQGQLQL